MDNKIKTLENIIDFLNKEYIHDDYVVDDGDLLTIMDMLDKAQGGWSFELEDSLNLINLKDKKEFRKFLNQFNNLEDLYYSIEDGLQYVNCGYIFSKKLSSGEVELSNIYKNDVAEWLHNQLSALKREQE